MATITYRTTNLVSDAVLTLRSESWTRKLLYGANWSKIRMGFLLTVGDANTALANVPDFGLTFGVGSSLSFPPGHYDCSHLVGVCPSGSPVPGSLNLLTYSATAHAGWSSSGVNPNFFTRTQDPQVGPTWTVATTSSGAVAYAPDQTATLFTSVPKRNNMFVLEIFRGVGGGGATPTANFYYQLIAANQTGYYFTEADLMDAVSSLGTPTIQGLAFTPTTAIALAVSDVAGPLDSLFISHNKATCPVNISAVAACVHMEMNIALPGDVAGGNDSFGNYAAQNFPAYTTSGSMPLGDWYGTPSSWLVYGTGWTGTSMTAQNLAGTIIGLPYDPFTQYVVGTTPLTTEIISGTGWSGAGVFAGTDVNAAPQVGLTGTSTQCPMDLMVQYIVTGGIFTGNTILVSGTGWSNAGVVQGTDAIAAPELGLTGTSTQCPAELFVQYEPGAVTSGVTINAGTGWAGAGVIDS